MWCDDPRGVNRWKGYRAINREHCRDISLIADGVYSGSDRGCSEHSSPLFLGLVLVVDRSPRYEVDGRLRFWSKFDFGNSPAGCGSDRGPAGWLPQIYIYIYIYIVNEGTLMAF